MQRNRKMWPIYREKSSQQKFAPRKPRWVLERQGQSAIINRFKTKYIPNIFKTKEI